MRVINIVDRLDRINFGIWNSAVATAGELEKQFGATSEIWFPEWTREAEDKELNGAYPRPLVDLGRKGLKIACESAALDPDNDVIVSHGCWRYPTRWGRQLKARGCKWVGVPHGMLENWSVSQKRAKKWLYYHLVEKRYLKSAHGIRAVGRPEMEALQRTFGDELIWIPNGVESKPLDAEVLEKPLGRTFLFMARLHHKKGVMELLQGWINSRLSNLEGYTLKIAGPDDGLLTAVQQFLDTHDEVRNIQYLGAVYGEDKVKLLRESHFYILPSHSEGFPTSVLEAMQYGLVPVISTGCNFPDVFEKRLGVQVEPEVASVKHGLEKVLSMDELERTRISEASQELIEEEYTHAKLARKQFEFYKQLMSKE